jgi:hypothetical protein
MLIGDKSSATKVFLGGSVEKAKLFHTVDENTLLQLENKNDQN